MYFRIPLNNWQLLHPPTWPFFKLRVVTVCGYVKSGSPWRRKSKSRLICAVQQITVKRIDYGFQPPTTSTVNIVIVSWMRCHAGFIIGYYSLHGNVLCKRFHHTSTATTSSITTWAFSTFFSHFPFLLISFGSVFILYIHAPTLRKYKGSG